MNSETDTSITLLTNMGIKGKDPFKLLGLLDASFCMSDMKNLGICIGVKNYQKTIDNQTYECLIQVLLVSDNLLIIDQVEGLVQSLFTVEEVLEDPETAFGTAAQAAIERYYQMKELKEKMRVESK
ncbi:MAG: hypothetical protein ACFFCQ_13715 [Promethearchaeota archaeon]